MFFSATFKCTLAVLLTLLVSQDAPADTVYLKTGRILHGEVSEGTAERGGDYILLKTKSGAIYKLDKGDIVKSIIKRDQVDLDYAAKRRHISNTATDHIELAKWCEKQERGKTRFREQIRWHYKNVVRLDPEHTSARKKLGYMKLENGTWVAEAEFKQRQGYRPDRRDWVAALAQEVRTANERADAETGAKKGEFKRWLKRAKQGDHQPAVLANLCDRSTLGDVYESAIREIDNTELTRVHLDAISQVDSNVAVRILAQFAMMAPSKELREHAISLLSQPEINHIKAVLALAEGLKFSTREIVHNAAFAIGEVSSTDQYSRDLVILPLVDSLITTHTERIEGALEAGRLSTSFGNGGTGFQTGGGPQTKKVNYKNEPSLAALRRLVETDFDFDEPAWRDWYIENYTLSRLDVRVDP